VDGLLLVHRTGDRVLPGDWRAPFDQAALLATIALERERTANRLRESEARRVQLEMAIEGSATGIWDRNLQTGEINYSDGWKALLGYRPPEISNRIEDAYQRVHPDDLEFVKATIQAHVDGKTDCYQVEHRIRCKDGGYKWISSRGRIVEWDDAGRPLRMIGATIDITERKRIELELQEFATTDFLTGLSNRRHFMERMENELNRIKRINGARAAVLMCDLDHFKQVNDRHGHAAGDAALRHFAAILCATMRKIDIAGRVGGEEFAVLLPGAEEGAGYFLAQRVQQELALQPFRDDAGEISMTVSIGITALCATDSDAGNALSRSDQALYRAKREGRNRIEIERG
jgi:diguanylate cyclase (GGDEF)-like protein/PAS domain S-box-containing protein